MVLAERHVMKCAAWLLGSIIAASLATGCGNACDCGTSRQPPACASQCYLTVCYSPLTCGAPCDVPGYACSQPTHETDNFVCGSDGVWGGAACAADLTINTPGDLGGSD